MTETIIAIGEASWAETHQGYFGRSPDEEYVGFTVTTDRQTIRLGISAGVMCCEKYGYFMTNDSVSEFIGAKLLDVKVVDTSLKVHPVESDGWNERQTMFVNLETDRGTLQFTAYNEHNGYYGHQAKVSSVQLTHEETL